MLFKRYKTQIQLNTAEGSISSNCIEGNNLAIHIKNSIQRYGELYEVERFRETVQAFLDAHIPFTFRRPAFRVLVPADFSDFYKESLLQALQPLRPSEVAIVPDVLVKAREAGFPLDSERVFSILHVVDEHRIELVQIHKKKVTGASILDDIVIEKGALSRKDAEKIAEEFGRIEKDATKKPQKRDVIVLGNLELESKIYLGKVLERVVV